MRRNEIGVLRLRSSVRDRTDVLRSDVMKTRKSVPPRVEYVLEAQALKEARDDPHWRRSSPEILLHDGVGSKRQDSAGGGSDQREAGAAAVFSAVSGEGSTGGSGGMRLLAGVSRSGGTGSEAVGVGASAAGQGDRQCQAEERPGGLGHAGALVALRLVAGVVEGGPGGHRRGDSRCVCGRRWCGIGRG